MGEEMIVTAFICITILACFSLVAVVKAFNRGFILASKPEEASEPVFNLPNKPKKKAELSKEQKEILKDIAEIDAYMG